VFFIYNGSNMKFNDINLEYQGDQNSDIGIKVAGPATNSISLKEISLKNIDQMYSTGSEVQKSAVTRE